MKPRLLILTNLYALPWEPNRATYNQQQFYGLSREFDVTLLIPISWLAVLKNLRMYWHFKKPTRAAPEYRIVYTVYWHVPGIGYSLNAFFMRLSVLIQNPGLIWGHRWSAILGSWGYPDGSVAVWLARRLGIPVVVKVHGSDINVIAEMPGVRHILARDLWRADRVVAVSQALRNKVIGLSISESRVAVIYNGVDVKHFRPRPRATCRDQLGLDAARGVILYVGNLYETKGVRDLLEAFIAVAIKRADLDLVFVGSGPCRKIIEERARQMGLSERIRLAGSVNHRDLPVWFNAASVLCLPSYNEGVPNVILEAMACGTRVIATRVGGIPEVLSLDRGELIDAGDISALASALLGIDGSSSSTESSHASLSVLSWEESTNALAETIRAAMATHV